ncbi:hypothetical protein FZ989_03120 [Clostridium perfringens]|nr:hypothetical protein [Clostridium perfringens]
MEIEYIKIIFRRDIVYNVAIVGATGNVGRKFLEILEERNFPVKNYIYSHQKDQQEKL